MIIGKNFKNDKVYSFFEKHKRFSKNLCFLLMRTGLIVSILLFMNKDQKYIFFIPHIFQFETKIYLNSTYFKKI